MNPNNYIDAMIGKEVAAVIAGEASTGKLVAFDDLAYVVKDENDGVYIITRSAVDMLLLAEQVQAE